jgi:UDP-N-acetylmuramoylalanine--D-glutamate ligase
MARWCALRGRARARGRQPRHAARGRCAARGRAAGRDLHRRFGDEVLDGSTWSRSAPGSTRASGSPPQARRRGLPLTGEMSLLAQALDELGVRAQTRILAITGTNGKTTTTALTAALAQSAGIDAVAAGNISPAALDVLMERLEIGAALPACWVLELSSFQIETMRGLDAEAATVLNVTDDHLDRYAGLDEYAATKAAIFQGEGVQVLNREDARVAPWRCPAGARSASAPRRPASDTDYGLADLAAAPG